MICLFPRQTIQHHSNPSLCLNHNAEEAEVEWFYEDLEDLLELTLKKMSFSSRGLECRSRKSRDNLELEASLTLENKMKQGKG